MFALRSFCVKLFKKRYSKRVDGGRTPPCPSAQSRIGGSCPEKKNDKNDKISDRKKFFHEIVVQNILFAHENLFFGNDFWPNENLKIWDQDVKYGKRHRF